MVSTAVGSDLIWINEGVVLRLRRRGAEAVMDPPAFMTATHPIGATSRLGHYWPAMTTTMIVPQVVSRMFATGYDGV